MTEHSDRARERGARRGIQSVTTGLRVLKALAAAGGPTTLTALGASSGLSPSQTHRYLQSLMAAGMAVQDAGSRYDLGPAVVRLGLTALARSNVFAAAEAALARFVEDTGWTAAVCVWSDKGPVCVRWLPGKPPVITTVSVGSVLPLLETATGRIFLALLTPQEIAGPLAAAQARGAALPDLDQLRATVRTTLMAWADNDIFPGLRTIGAPMFDLQGRPFAVASALATKACPRDADDEVARRLLQACQEATAHAGGRWPA